MRTIFLVGTSFCGSTALSRELSRDSRIDMMGEINRLPTLRLSAQPNDEHAEARCRVCFVGGREDECPVFNEELLGETDHGPLGDRYTAVRRRFGAEIALDGSKNPWWMRTVVLEAPYIQPAAIILARLPWAYAHSLKAADGTEYVGGAMIWRDVYQGALRIVADLGVPSVVIRYEDFLLNRSFGDAALARLFGFRPEHARPQAVGLHHAIGGNLGGFLAMEGLDEAALKRSVSGETHRSGAYEDSQEAYKLEIAQLRSDELTLVERWRAEMTVEDIAAILHTPGVWDTAHLLGYDLVHHLNRPG